MLRWLQQRADGDILAIESVNELTAVQLGGRGDHFKRSAAGQREAGPLLAVRLLQKENKMNPSLPQSLRRAIGEDDSLVRLQRVLAVQETLRLLVILISFGPVLLLPADISQSGCFFPLIKAFIELFVVILGFFIGKHFHAG